MRYVPTREAVAALRARWRGPTPGAAALFLVSFSMFVYGVTVLVDLRNKQQERQDQQIQTNRVLVKRLAADEAVVRRQVVELRGQRYAACLQSDNTRIALRRVLAFAEGFTLSDPKLTPQVRVQVVRFYDGALRLVPEIVCKP